MANQSWVSLINSGSRSIGPGVLYTGTSIATITPVAGAGVTSDVALVNADGQPGGWYLGMVVRILARGFLTTGSTTTTCTLTLRANKGNTGTYVTLGATNGITTGTGSLVGLPWKLEAVSHVTALATTGNTINTEGELTLSNVVNASPVVLTTTTTNNLVIPIPNVSGETAAAVDTSQLTGISLAATLAAYPACSIQCTQWLVEALN